jgi:hypothetical protein
MAIAVAALLGFRFPANFNQPYRAQRLREFIHFTAAGYELIAQKIIGGLATAGGTRNEGG